MSQPPNVPQPLPDDFEELEFDIVEEHWNEYELSDGNHIQGRIFLRKLVRDPNNPISMNVNASAPIYVVYAPTANRGERNNAPRPQELSTLPRHEVRITTNNEQFNLYTIRRNGQRIRLRLAVARINRINDRFDNDGLPFYLVEAGPMFLVDPPPNENQGQ